MDALDGLAKDIIRDYTGKTVTETELKNLMNAVKDAVVIEMTNYSSRMRFAETDDPRVVAAILASVPNVKAVFISNFFLIVADRPVSEAGMFDLLRLVQAAETTAKTAIYSIRRSEANFYSLEERRS